MNTGRWRKKAAACLLALLVAVLCAVPVGASEDVPQAVLEARAGVVRVFVYGEYESWTGTGFVIGGPEQQYVVTNAHVTENAEEILIFYDTGLYVLADIVKEDKSRDLGILRPQRSIPGAVSLPLRTRDIDSGISVYALGYPGAADKLVGDYAESLSDFTADKQSMTITDGIIGAVRDSTVVGDMSATVRIIQTNTSISGGNSGGPLLDAEGNVVGVNTYGLASSEVANMNACILGTELVTLLKSQQISFTEPAIPPPPAESKPAAVSELYKAASLPVQPNQTGLVVGLCAIALVMLGGVVFLVILSKRRAPVKGGVSLTQYEVACARLPEVPLSAMVQNFVGHLLALRLSAWELNLLLTPDNIYIGTNSIQLKNKQPANSKMLKLEIYPGLSAPETYRNRGAEPACVYLLGAVLHTLLVGHRADDALNRLDTNAPVFYTPSALQSVVNQAMEPHEQNRIPTLYALQDALRRSYAATVYENTPPPSVWAATGFNK